MPRLLRELFLDAAVEEERNMRVLLGFCIGVGDKITKCRKKEKRRKKYSPAICACVAPSFANHSARTLVMA